MTVLENSIRVLRCFSATRKDVTVTEVSGLLELPKSNVSRLLRAMRDVGLLDAAEESRAYRPGLLLLELGQVLRSGQSLVARADDAVRGICEELGHTGYVSVRLGRSVIGVSHHAGRNPLQVGIPLGNRLDVDACATGRSLLALMRDDQVRELLDGKLSRATPSSPATFRDLFQRLSLVRSRGYSESTDEAGKGVGAFAVAVQNPRNGENLSMCITFPAATTEQKERDLVIRSVLRAQADVSRLLS